MFYNFQKPLFWNNKAGFAPLSLNHTWWKRWTKSPLKIIVNPQFKPERSHPTWGDLCVLKMVSAKGNFRTQEKLSFFWNQNINAANTIFGALFLAYFRGGVRIFFTHKSNFMLSTWVAFVFFDILAAVR